MKAQKRTAPTNDRLAEIYRTAAQIILRKGYDATSVNDIANALGMTKAGLYHYINGKKELLFDRAPTLHHRQPRPSGDERQRSHHHPRRRDHGARARAE
jgi:hypothetical protein